MVFESGTGVMWIRGERETGAAKFKRGDVVGFVWKATSNVGSPSLELYVNGRMSVGHDWSNFNASLGSCTQYSIHYHITYVGYCWFICRF